ncbi:response regulator [uncultured Jatrophihabitans sp.]|uniref:ATP-binding response regulator n=1 Tax=uncultured Jatrophihabitans sp. TaxID=1610747 RepID=UPI0035CBFAB0
MIADDDDDIRLLLTMAMANRADIELIAEATHGADAIRLVEALRPDLLVLDVEMPVLDGISALPRLREVSPDTRVVMFSASNTPDHHRRAFAAGAAAYVRKGAPASSLVDDLLQAGELLDSVVGSLTRYSRLVDVAHDATVPARARRFAVDTLSSWGERSVLETVALLVSELVTNVIVHTSTAPELGVRLFDDRVHVEVFDADPTAPAPRTAQDHEASGRGMAILETLALDWGWVPTNGGKVVWFDVSR